MARQNSFKPHHVIFMMYITMSETVIKIDLLQHLVFSRETWPTKRPKIRVTTFTVLTLNISVLFQFKHTEFFTLV